MSRSLVILILILLVFGSFFTTLFYDDVSREARFLWTDIRHSIWEPARTTVAFEDGTRLLLPVAETDGALRRGLMFRRSLREDDGLVLAFPAPELQSIWMKNVFFDLDLFWVQDDRVVYLAEGAVRAPGAENPVIYTTDTPASYVVELPAGFAKAHTIAVGDLLEITRD